MKLDGFTTTQIEETPPVYMHSGVFSGVSIEIYEVHYKGVDYSMYADGQPIFSGYREEYAKEEIQKFIKGIHDRNNASTRNQSR